MSALTKRGTPRLRNYPANRVSRGTPIYDRVLRYVREDADTGCWLWTAHTVVGSGYGSIQIDGRRRNAHRVAYEAFIGVVPDGLHLDHRPPGASNPNGRRQCRTCVEAYRAIYRAMTPDERAARKAAGLPVVDLNAYFTEELDVAA
jgi:hypothetical protein